MTRLRPEKLHVNRRIEESQQLPRRYTLTHSDFTGDLHLTVAGEYDKKQVSGLYTRIMRDEVLAEWRMQEGTPILHIYCHVAGGLVFGGESMREGIFRREMPLVLEAIREGDSKFFNLNPEFDEASILIHFQKSGEDYKIERFGKPSDYKLNK